jgi:hypothetical protein
MIAHFQVAEPAAETLCKGLEKTSIMILWGAVMSGAEAKPRLLNSWKEIAAYLGRGVRTVQRWEKFGLPVRRVGFGTRSPVMACVRDVDLWLQTTPVREFTGPHAEWSSRVSKSLHESIRRAQLLRDQMVVLRNDGMLSLQQLIATVAAMEKTYASGRATSFELPSDARAISDIPPAKLLEASPMLAVERQARGNTFNGLSSR